jgi:hypothetical protein
MALSVEKLSYIIEKAREFDAEVAPADDETPTEEGDEEVEDILEATRSNPTYAELIAAVEGLNDDERSELVAMMWIGRGDFSPGDWDQALAEAQARHNGREAAYLAGTPLLADYLEDAADELGYELEG